MIRKLANCCVVAIICLPVVANGQPVATPPSDGPPTPGAPFRGHETVAQGRPVPSDQPMTGQWTFDGKLST